MEQVAAWWTRGARWPFQKDEIDVLLGTMARHKNILVFILQSEYAGLYLMLSSLLIPS